jgi:hypothetical protein
MQMPWYDKEQMSNIYLEERVFEALTSCVMRINVLCVFRKSGELKIKHMGKKYM